MAFGSQYIYKHAFDFYYVWVPTGSNQVDKSWPTGSISASITNENSFGITNGLYENALTFGGVQATRAIPLIAPADAEGGGGGATGADEAAIPKGSSAIDYLWNVQSLSSSYHEYTIIFGRTTYYREFRFTYNTESFNYYNIGANPANKFGLSSSGFGLTKYPVTSSWVTYEPKMYEANFTWSLESGTSYTAPMTLNTPANPYSKPTARNITKPSYAEAPFLETVAQSSPLPAGTNPTNLTYGNESTGSNDGRFFDLAGGCGITREAISASLVLYEANQDGATLASRNACTIALKQRRLFFPTIITGSSNPYTQTGSAAIGSEWIAFVAGGAGSDVFFDENGGIYNVKFNIKRDIANDFYPDSGGSSELMVYIFDVQTRLQQRAISSSPGDVGYYPPDNNIIRIKNQPEMSFANPATGFLIETFNINVVQYGTPAQLVFEPSGSLVDEKYFGCIIDDVTFCKIGVSTDPNLIKPETTGEESGATKPPPALG